ncbi:alkaline phosphatase family protein [Rhodohalobacter halophilus]|uniref:alkaline phosphatase family protein n=1 Tax=Rhodohalobacter halophilus TaxID=1812810 RepID=UPI001FE09986|nr:ectonucleotide pyrophosphatase/phosphodiesterase [Rhodohalobacter halophilus]
MSCSEETEPQKAKLLLISIDGFHPDYLDRYETSNLDQLVETGVLADFMIPVFPTKTFPNHYSIVTGLYPENSGLIANNMYDAEMDAFYSLGNREAVRNAQWYEGEPIWVTAEKQGLKTAPMFWPGSEAPIGGEFPTYSYPYDDDLPYTARVDSVIHWMTMEPELSPGFMTLYFSKVDTYGHRYGPESDSTAAAVREVDEQIGYLMSELERTDLLNDLNIIIVSDHGMADVSDERVILLDQLIDHETVEVIDWNPVAMIRPNEGISAEIYESLKANEENFRVYKKEDLPNRLHFKKHDRVPEIILIADLGYSITTSGRLEQYGVTGGAHGYDNRYPEMHSFFLAAGPSFRQGITTEGFQNIHLYELMAHLLDLEPSPNDGRLGSLIHILEPQFK